VLDRVEQGFELAVEAFIACYGVPPAVSAAGKTGKAVVDAAVRMAKKTRNACT